VDKLKLKLPAVVLEPGQKAFLNFRFFAAQTTAWCEAGHTLGWTSCLPLKVTKPVKAIKSSEPQGQPLKVKQSDKAFSIGNNKLRLRVSTASGLIESLKWNGHDLLMAGPNSKSGAAPRTTTASRAGTTFGVLGKWQRQGSIS